MGNRILLLKITCNIPCFRNTELELTEAESNINVGSFEGENVSKFLRVSTAHIVRFVPPC